MNESANKITFSLNEILTFEVGQDIDEMISISLNPDIIIQSYDDYVQIRGVIFLSGDFYKRETASEINFSKMERSFNYVEKIIEKENNVVHFSHRFPVE